MYMYTMIVKPKKNESCGNPTLLWRRRKNEECENDTQIQTKGDCNQIQDYWIL